jgi:hypothetical protein
MLRLLDGIPDVAFNMLRLLDDIPDIKKVVVSR